MGAEIDEGFAPSAHEQLNLFFGATVMMAPLAFEQSGSWVGHEHELHGFAGRVVLQSQECRFGREIEPSGRQGIAGFADRGRSQRHGGNERFAEILVIVIAGQSEDRAAGFEELAEDFLPVDDCLSQPVGTGQFAEEIAGDEQNLNPLLLADFRNPLDRCAEVGGAVDSADSVAEVPVGGMEDSHIGVIV